MRIHFHWGEIRRHEIEDKNGNGLITRALMNDEPLPRRRTVYQKPIHLFLFVVLTQLVHHVSSGGA